VLQMIDEGAGSTWQPAQLSTDRAGTAWRTGSRRGARLARIGGELAGRAEARIGQEVDILDVGDDRIENRGRRLGSANSPTMTSRTKSRSDAVARCVRKERDSAPAQARIVTASKMPLSAFGLNSAPVVSKVPGRDDNPGTNSLALDTPLSGRCCS